VDHGFLIVNHFLKCMKIQSILLTKSKIKSILYSNVFLLYPYFCDEETSRLPQFFCLLINFIRKSTYKSDSIFLSLYCLAPIYHFFHNLHRISFNAMSIAKLE
jgi:hypothetical protein